jgi:hypothetical protein
LQGIAALAPTADRLAAFEPFNHPDLAGSEAMVFGLAAAAYRALSGSLPFRAETPEDLRDMIRELPAPPLEIARPDLRADVSTFFRSCLSPAKGRPRPTLAEWVTEVKGWSSLRERVSESDKTLRRRTAEVAARRALDDYRLRRYWRRNWKTAAVAALAVLVLGYVAATIAGNLLRPRAIAGLEPRQVVETFYAAMNALDHQTMEDCVVGDAGKGYINEVINLFVISRARMAVEGANPFVDARSWIAKGRPPLAHGAAVYGVGPLSIREVPGTAEGFRTYEVEFERWTPRAGEADSTGPAASSPLGVLVVERCYLELDRGNWLLYRLDRMSQSPIE